MADTLTGDLTFYANGTFENDWDTVTTFRGVKEACLESAATGTEVTSGTRTPEGQPVRAGSTYCSSRRQSMMTAVGWNSSSCDGRR